MMPFVTSLLFGALSASFALIIEILVNIPVLSILLGAAIIEELSKYIFFKQYAKYFSSIIPSSIQQSIALGTSFGLGFAVLELFLMSYNLQLATIPFWAMFGSVGLHIITGIIFAIFLFFRPRRIRLWRTLYQKRFTNLLAIALAIFLHILYNTFAFVSLF